MANILIVDDSKIMRRNLTNILQRAGHKVLAEASNGLEGYNFYKKLKPDLVTMDITMPVLDGIGSVKKIMSEFPDAKIIMVSALDQKQMVFSAIKLGAKHYIIKPINPENVLKTINEILNPKTSNLKREDSPPKLEKNQYEIKTKNVLRFFPNSFSLKQDELYLLILEITKETSIDKLNDFNDYLKELLETESLELVFNFGKIETLSDDKVKSFENIFKKICSIREKVNVVSENNKLEKIFDYEELNIDCYFGLDDYYEELKDVDEDIF